jgi:hypothetical protein
MKPGVRPVARAFQLARSGAMRDMWELKQAMVREGYDPRKIEGKAIHGQLRDLIKAARGRVEPEPKWDP